MNTPATLAPQPTKFARQSDTESICMSCFAIIRADRYLPVEVAEEIHSDVCLVGPDSLAQYLLL
jgi:hypothetical protein